MNDEFITDSEKVGASGARLLRAKVLVVDDEATVSAPIERVLSSAGFEVVVARSGTEAIELITNTPFDVILSDIHMPRLDGVQLLRLIRLRDLEVPVVLMTGEPHASRVVLEVTEAKLGCPLFQGYLFGKPSRGFVVPAAR